MRRRREEADETVRKLTDIARTHFTEYGYAGAALESIGRDARLTRGAIYHHFRSKKELFRAVLEHVQQEVAERVEREAMGSEEMWEQLAFGCRAFVMAAVEERSKRIMLIDGPAVVGWEAWRAMDRSHSMRLLRAQLDAMQQQGHLVRTVSVDALTCFISGGLNETAIWLAQETAARPDDAEKTARRDAPEKAESSEEEKRSEATVLLLEQLLEHLLTGLRGRPASRQAGPPGADAAR